jgi:hypothetical protein
MSIFEDPEERRARKIRKIARSGAYAIGGGAGMWFLNALYPYEESAEKIASLFGWIGTLLMVYGLISLASVIFKKNLAIPVNILMSWVIVPGALVFIFSKFWTGS